MSSIIMTTDEPGTLLTRIRQIPAFHTLGIRELSFDKGICRAVVPKNDAMDGIFQSYHGGMLMVAADTIACFALLTLTGPDAWMTTTDMNIRCLRACLTDVTAEATVIKFGRQLCPVAVNLYDAQERLVAVAQVTYMRLEEAPRHKPIH